MDIQGQRRDQQVCGPWYFAHPSDSDSASSHIVPALCDYVVGFSTVRLFDITVQTETQAFLQSVLCYGQPVEAADCQNLCSAKMAELTYPIVGVRSHRTTKSPTWLVYTHVDPKRTIYGLPLPACPDCEEEVGSHDRPNHRKHSTRWLSCKNCKIVSANLTLPPNGLAVAGYRDITVWQWPLKQQEWKWTESGRKRGYLRLAW